MSGSILAEQETSLLAKLDHEQFRTGDSARIVIPGVGVSTNPAGPPITRLAFCPVDDIIILDRDRRTLSCRKTFPEIHFTCASKKLVRSLRGQNGFARIICDLRLQENIRIASLKILDFQSFSGPTNRPGAYRQFSELVT